MNHGRSRKRRGRGWRRIWSVCLASLLLATTLLGNMTISVSAEETGTKTEEEHICNHEHTAECYEEVFRWLCGYDDNEYVTFDSKATTSNATGETYSVATPSDATPADAEGEPHVHNEDCDCEIELVLNCQHVHDENCGYYGNAEPAVSIEDLQARIDALPSVEELEAMDESEIEEVYAEAQELYGLFNALTEEEQEEIDADDLLALLEYFAGNTAALDETDTGDGTWLTDDQVTVTVEEVQDNWETEEIFPSEDTGLYSVTRGNEYLITLKAEFSLMEPGIYYYQLPYQFTYQETDEYYGGSRTSDNYEVWMHIDSSGLVTFVVKETSGTVSISKENSCTVDYSYNKDGGDDDEEYSVAKDMTEDPSTNNDYTASFEVRLNQIHEYCDFPLVMEDNMTNLSYVPGSLVIVETAKDGTQRTLESSEYSLKVITLSDGSTEMLVTIYNPGDNMYTLTYQACMVDTGTGSRVTYRNTAHGEVQAGRWSASIYAERYRVIISKTDADTGEPLAGVTFKLRGMDSDEPMVDEYGTTVDSHTTDASGLVEFGTKADHFAYATHTLYYIQETDVPAGYELQEGGTYPKLYFCWCDTDDCEICQEYVDEYGATKIEKINQTLYSYTFDVTNKYRTAGTLTFPVTKTYNSWSTMGENESFVFRLGTTGGAPLPEGDTYTETRKDGTEITYASISISGSGASGKADGESVSKTFGEITFTAAGTYTYYLDEIRQSEMPAGVSITGVREYEITVVATDNGDGTLTVEITKVTYTDPETDETVEVTGDDLTNFTFAFENTYEAGSQSKSLLGYKTFVNSARQNDTNWGGRSFSFLFTALTDDAPVPSGVTGTSWGVTTSSRTFTSGNMTFTMEDVGKTYYYSIQEQLTIGDTTYTVSDLAAMDENDLPDGVTLEKDTDGNVVAVTYQSTHYDPTIVCAQMSVTYQNEDIDAITVTDSYGDETIYTLQTIPYGGKTYNYAGTNTNNAGLSYYECFNEDGTLEVLVYNPGNYEVTVTAYDEYREKTSETTGTLDEVVYSNDYESVTYNVENRTYTDGDGNPIAGENVKRDSGAYIVVVPVTYGTFVDGEFVAYDSDSTHQTTQDTAGGETTRALFTNSYDAEAAASTLLTGTKTLGGRAFADGDTFTFNIEKTSWTSGNTDWNAADMPDFEITYTDSAGEEVPIYFTSVTITYNAESENFTIRYQDSDGNEVYRYTSSDAIIATANSDGSVAYSFHFDIGRVIFDLVGDYTYTFSEATGSLSHMTYSTTTHRIVYSVKNDQEGSLYVSGVTVDGTDSTDTAQNVEWTNRYRMTGYSPSVTKAVKSTNGEAVTETFTFALYGGYNAETGELSDRIGTAAVNGSGQVEFDSLTYTLTGTYTYYIQEVIPETNAEGMTYDDSVIKVEVIVSTNAAGGLYVSSTTYTNLSTGARVVYSYNAAGEVTETAYYTGTYQDGEWTFEATGTANDADVITNTYTPDGGGGGGGGKTGLTVKKVWILDDGGKAADSVAVNLLKDGEVYETVTLNRENGWTYTWTGLDDSYTWTVEEADVPDGFTSSVTHDGTVWTITNNDTPEGGGGGGDNPGPANTELTVKKIWTLDDGGTAADSVTVNLLKDGEISETVTLSAENGWTYTWTGLDGSYTWTVAEADVPDGFTSSVTHDGTVWTITNNDTPDEGTETGSLTVKKTVSGGGASKTKAFTFTVTLSDTSINGTYGDMEFTDGVATFTLKHGESRTANGLPLGTTYTVSEDSGSYTPSVTEGSLTGEITEGGTRVTVNNYKGSGGGGGGGGGSDNPEPTPDNPDNPDTPNNPDGPNTPDNPANPDSPNTPDTSTPGTPLDDVPQTGDNTHLSLWLTLMLLSLLGMAGTVAIGRKTRYRGAYEAGHGRSRREQ